MSTTFNLSDEYNSSSVAQSIDGFARRTIAAHYMLAMAVIIILVLVLIIMYIKSKGEHASNPTGSSRFVTGDQYGLSNPREGLAVYPAKDDTPGTLIPDDIHDNVDLPTFGRVDPNAGVNMPGSLGYMILNSADMNCANRKPIGTDAWSWLTKTAQLGEMATSGRFIPSNDSAFSKLAAGY